MYSIISILLYFVSDPVSGNKSHKKQTVQATYTLMHIHFKT